MAKYKWDLCELRNNIKIIESLLEKENDTYTRELMKDTISQYHYMIHSTILRDFEDLDVIEEQNTITDFLEEILEDATRYDARLINLLTSTYPIIKDFNPKDNTQYIICKNNDELLEETNDFLKQTLNKSQYEKYKQEILDNPNHLHIQYSQQSVKGTTFIDSILKKKYVLLNRCNEPTDITSISHEYFHFVFNDFTAHKIFKSTLSYSRELEGSFANFLTMRI